MAKKTSNGGSSNIPADVPAGYENVYRANPGLYGAGNRETPSDPGAYQSSANQNPALARQFNTQAQAMGLSLPDYYQYLASSGGGFNPSAIPAQKLAIQGQQALRGQAEQAGLVQPQGQPNVQMQYSPQVQAATQSVQPTITPTVSPVTPAQPYATVPTVGVLPPAAPGLQAQAQQPQYFQGGGEVGSLEQAEGNPAFMPYFLGASALQMPAYVNLPPNQGQMGQGSFGPSGVYPGSQQAVEYMDPTNVAGGFAPRAPGGPWNKVPGLFMAAPTPQPTQGGMPVTPTPVYAGVTSGPGTGGTPAVRTPWATAAMPQTPTVSPAATVPQAQTPMLSIAPPQRGQFIAQQGWQPPAAPGAMPMARPAPYTGELHNDPHLSNAVTTLLGLPSNPWHPAGGGGGTAATGAGTALATAAALGSGATRQMHQGGYVRGYQDGGSVPFDEPNPTPVQYESGIPPSPREVPRSMDRSTQPRSQQEASHVIDSLARDLSSAVAPQGSNAPTVGSYTGAYNAGQALPAGAGGAPNIGSLAGEQAYVTGEPVSGVGGGGMSPQLGSALGGIGQGLTQAAQAIASSVKPWQMQRSAIPQPQTSSAPATQFQQETVPQGGQTMNLGQLPYYYPQQQVT